MALVPEWLWNNVPFHSAVEVAGGLFALALAAILLASRKPGSNQHHLWVAVALVGMGILDIAHAAVVSGNTFVWFHSTAVCVGGVLFALVWLPARIADSPRCRLVLPLTIAAVVALCACSLGFPRLIPAMVEQGAFTATARGLNVLGGLGFLAAAVWFLKRYRATRRWDDYLFACLCGLFGAAGVPFELSSLWDAAWWWWHLLRLAAYALAITYSAVVYYRTSKQLRGEIEERKRVEAKGAQEETLLFRRFADSSGQGLAMATLEGNISYANPTLCTILDLDGPEDALGKSFILYYAEELHQRLRDEILPTVMKEGQWKGELALRSTRGKVTPTLENIFLVLDADGEPLCLAGLMTDISEQKRTEAALQNRTHELGERVKELRGLYAVSELAGRRDLALNQILQGAVDVIPPAWQYPPITCARVVVENETFPTANFRETAWKQAVPITVLGEAAGGVEVFYLDEKPERDEGPFLKEERDLLNAIAERLGRIIERRRAEEALRASENKHRTLLESLPQKIFLKDRGSVYVSCNEHYARDLGIRPEEIAGKTDYDFYPKELAEKYRVDDRRIVESGQIEDLEEEYIQDGQEAFVHTVKAPVRDDKGTVVGVLGIFWDVTERKRAEEALRKSEEGLAEAQRIAHLGNWDWDIVANNLRWSDEIYRIFGLRPQEFGATYDAFLNSVHPDDREALREVVNNALADPTAAYDIEHRVVRPDGSERIVHEMGEVMRDTDGQPVRMVGTVQNITERKRAEQQLQHQAAELERARQRALNMMEDAQSLRREADRANAAKSQFLANMSHEIRTPMNAIIGFSTLLLEEDLTPEQHDTIQMIRTSGNNLLGLINNILDLSKVEAGRTTLDETDFSLHALVNDCASLIRNRCAERGLALAIEIADDLPDAVRTDEVKVRQVLTNLLSNAVKFTDQGTVTIGAGLRGEMIEIAVSDTGIGIPKDKLNTIFEPFAQADASTTRRFGGTGLGLTLCKHLSKLLGGDLRVESVEGRGSTFIFSFPYTPAATDLRQAAQAAAAATELAGHGLRVLVAEDDTFNRKFILRLLEKRGFEVLFAENGREALELARQRPDLVLMDMHMPVMSGYEATRALKADPELAPIPVIALTASAMKEDRDRALAVGCDGFAAKPVRTTELFVEMRRVLAGTGMPDQMAPALSPDEPAAVAEPEEMAALMTELRRDYMAEFADVLAEFDTFVTDGDAAALAGLGHRLKGNGASYGFPEITDIGARIEDLGKADQLDAIRPLIAQLRHIHAEFRAP